MQEIEGYDEPDPDSDYDYEDTYAKKRKRRSTKNSRGGVSDSPMRRGIKVMSIYFYFNPTDDRLQLAF